MATKKTGLSLELIIHPGETIADILEARGITQAELAVRTGVSTAYVSSIIKGKKNISSNFAMALEYALGVPKSFWLNLQANYDAELLDYCESETVSAQEEEVYRHIKDVTKYLRSKGLIPTRQKKNDAIIALRKWFRVSDLSNLGQLSVQGAFRVSTNNAVDPYVMGAWLQLCQMIGDDQEVLSQFDVSKIDSLIAELKEIMVSQSGDLQKVLMGTMAKYGIKFSVVRNFRGAPVQGYISVDKDGTYQMTLTIRGAFADIFWFSLFHELGHIVNGDVSKSSKYIDRHSDEQTKQEIRADEFASSKLLDPISYQMFINVGDYSIFAIERFAQEQKVMPYIVIGRLQKEQLIPYDWYSKYKLRYKWG